MCNYILYFHGGSKNHGCEAIVRATTKLIGQNVSLFSNHKDEDLFYGLDRICEINDLATPLKRFSMPYWKASINFYLLNRGTAFDEEMFQPIYKKMNEAGFLLSIGGDNYCYEMPAYYLSLNRRLKKYGKKMVLWGASVELDKVSPSVFQDLKLYSSIVARESLSAEDLKNNGFDNVYLFPDPAFSLNKNELSIPAGFKEGNTIGINVSPLVMDYETSKGMTWKNYESLIEYLIETTDMQIALIPHVVWKGNDDRQPLGLLYDKYKETGRVVMIEDHNCEELKGFISRCRFMIVARTHASIAAYSTEVPTLVVGYSVKAKGIAKDIFGTYDNYVIPVQSLQDERTLINGFEYMVKHEDEIRRHYHDFMPEYIHRLDKIIDIIE